MWTENEEQVSISSGKGRSFANSPACSPPAMGKGCWSPPSSWQTGSAAAT